MIYFRARTVRVRKEAPIMRNVFWCAVHESHRPSEHLLDPDFYESGPEQAAPIGLHYEMELQDTGRWNDHPFRNSLHIRTSKLNGRKFVCLPKRIDSIPEAVRLFWTWSIGTTFTVTDPQGRDFQNICLTGEGFESLWRRLRQDHGIRVADFQIYERK